MSIPCLNSALRGLPDPVRRLADIPGLYLVGGMLRDMYWGRESKDIDLVAPEPLAPLLETITSRLGAVPFELNQRFQSYRAVVNGFELDISPLHGGSIDEDIKRRDYTVNALALPLSSIGGDVTVADISACESTFADLDSRVLRMVSRQNLVDDPLRIMRGYRLAATCDLAPDPDTRAAWKELSGRITESAGERIHEELLRWFGIRGAISKTLKWALDDGLLFTLFPALRAAVGCIQNEYHHLDVWEHTALSVAEFDRLMDDPPEGIAEYTDGLWEEWHRPVSGMASAGALTRLSVLLHDIGKPVTREVQEDGHVSFYNHQIEGVKLITPLLKGLKFATDEIEFITLLVREHLRLGFYSDHDPMPKKLIYRFIRKLGDAAPMMLMHGLADCSATQGALNKTGMAEHIRGAATIIRHYYAQDSVAAPEVFLDGNAIMELLGIGPGRLVGRLKEAMLEATAAGELAGVEDAKRYVREQYESGELAEGE